MFFVFNKDKIYSYIVAFSTVVVLFVMSIYAENSSIQTSANEAGENTEANFINTNNTINCAD